jgi:type II secretory pathway component PulM
MATTLPSRAPSTFAQWWRLRSRREQMLLAAAAALVAFALLWLLAWQPLTHDADRLTRQLAIDRAALAEARLRGDEIAGLAQKPPSAPVADPRAALEGVLVRRDLKSTAMAVERVDNDRIRLTFDAIAFGALTDFLDVLQRDARLRAVELVVTARVEPGQVRADVTLSR